MTAWINGRRGTRLDVRDRGLHYGDGLFETLRVRHGAIRLLGYHMERLASGCGRLGIAPPEPDRLARELTRRAACTAHGVLKLIVTRGVGPRGYRPRGCGAPTTVITLHPLPPAARVPRAVRVRVCRTRLSSNERLAGLKTLNRLDCVLARAEWSDARIWEGLMRDADDHMVCGTMSNLFMRRGSLLATPMLDRCGVAGVMRRWVLEQAKRMRLTVSETRIAWRDLQRADEVFLTNAVVGVVPVAGVRQGRTSIHYADMHTARELGCLLEAL